MASKLSTHALDLYHGRPAEGLRVRLYRLPAEGGPVLVAETRTNRDGRTDKPLLGLDADFSGRYELVFDTGAYFTACGVALAEPPFLDEVPVRFALAAGPGAYHVPLLFSPWAYSTYRGS